MQHAIRLIDHESNQTAYAGTGNNPAEAISELLRAVSASYTDDADSAHHDLHEGFQQIYRQLLDGYDWPTIRAEVHGMDGTGLTLICEHTDDTAELPAVEPLPANVYSLTVAALHGILDDVAPWQFHVHNVSSATDEHINQSRTSCRLFIAGEWHRCTFRTAQEIATRAAEKLKA